jgi:hypothetical protein
MQYAIILHQNTRSSRDHHLHVTAYNFVTQKGAILTDLMRRSSITTGTTTTTGSITTTDSRRCRSTTSRQHRSFPPSLQDLHV